MDVSKAVLVSGAVVATGIAGITTWALWPEKRTLIHAKKIALTRMGGFKAAFQKCRDQETVDDVQRCVAGELYPLESWPPPDNAEKWQREEWTSLGRRVREAIRLTVRTANPGINMPNYEELKGMPRGCMNTSPWGFDPVEVMVPYGPVRESAASLQPLIHSDLYEFMAPESVYMTDSPPSQKLPDGGLGYENDQELKELKRLLSLSKTTVNDTDLYHQNAKSAIVKLAGKAHTLFDWIRSEYKRYHSGGGVTYPLKPTKFNQGTIAVFPLFVPESDIEDVIDTNKAGVWTLGRTESRQRIRDAYHKALHLLWCALYGKAQSESWNANKQIYDHGHQKTGAVGGFASRPVVEHPGPPNVNMNFAGGKEPEVIPPKRPQTPRPEGEGEDIEEEPTPTPTLVEVGMPLPAKIMLWGSLGTAIGGAGFMAYDRLRAR